MEWYNRLNYKTSLFFSGLPVLGNLFKAPKNSSLIFKNMKQYSKLNFDINLEIPYYISWRFDGVQKPFFSYGQDGVIATQAILLELRRQPWDDNPIYLMLDEVYITFNSESFIIEFFKRARILVKHSRDTNYYSRNEIKAMYQTSKRIYRAYAAQDEIGLSVREVYEAAQAKTQLNNQIMYQMKLTTKRGE